MSITALLYLMFIIFGLFKALFSRPIWGIYVYFFTFYLHAPSSWWGKSLPDIRWSLIAASVTLIALFISSEHKPFKFWSYKSNLVIAIFCLLVVVQIPLAINSVVHTEYVFLLVKFLLLIFIMQNSVKNIDDLKGVVWINVIGASYLAYIGISQFSGGRLEGLSTPGLGSANQLSQHFGAIIIFVSYSLLGNLDTKNLLKIPFILLILYALFLTESRGSILGLGAILLLALFFVPQHAKKKFYSFALLAAIAGSALMGPQIVERFASTQQNEMGEVKDASARSRFAIIESQWEMTKDSPIIGHGHRGTLLLSPIYIEERYLTKQGVRASHNLLMAMLVDHGFLGAFLYFLTVYLCIKQIFVAKRQAIGANKAEVNELKSLLIGSCMALTYYIVVGMASNNKPLEADIWFIALIPVIAMLIKNKTLESERN